MVAIRNLEILKKKNLTANTIGWEAIKFTRLPRQFL